MHEFGLCEGVLDAVRARAGGRPVAAVRVRFGVRHAVDQESLSLAFQTVAAGTEAADAAVELVTVPASIGCRSCGFDGETTDLLAVCPSCASSDVRLTGGDEMTLESVTYVPVPT
jgi:hydrogenase nickel incorporation protein HypA/HybF